MHVLYPGRVGIWRCWFLSREKTGEPGEKPLEQAENHRAGIEPRPQAREASDIPTAPSLFLKLIIYNVSLKFKESPYELSVHG